MNKKYANNTLKPSSLFQTIQEQYPLSDFFIRLDLVGILACKEIISVDLLLVQLWPKLFPSIPFTEDLSRNCYTYFDEYRQGFKFMSKGETLQNPMIILRTIIPIAVLLKIASNKNNYIDTNNLKYQIKNDLISVVRGKISVLPRLNDVLLQYFEESQYISDDTLKLLETYQYTLIYFYNMLYDSLSQSKNIRKPGKSAQNDISAENEAPQNTPVAFGHCTPLKYIRIICLLYLAIEEHKKTKEAREICIEKKWTEIFTNTEFSEEALEEIDAIIRNDEYLKAIDFLFKYPFREIKNSRIVRRIITGLFVNKVLSQLPHNSSLETVVDEAMSLFSGIPTLSIGKEEDDIEIYTRKFVTDDGNIDDRISEVLWKYSSLISSFYKQAVEDINSEDSARKRYWWEGLLDEKRQQVSDLQEELVITRANTIFELIETLNSPSYNFLLSRLYRFAYGYDQPSVDEIRMEVKNLIQVLHLFNVSTTDNNLIDKNISDPACEELNYKTAVISDMKSNTIVFPGWIVSGDTVTLPIASKETEE